MWRDASLSIAATGLPAPPPVGSVGLVDTTMLYAPASGGVRRYLNAKADWVARRRPSLRHRQVLPGPTDRDEAQIAFVQSAILPFTHGYRWPMNLAAWTERILRESPALIEAEDPYLPGKAALRAGQALGVPVVGFCHSDVAALTRRLLDGRGAVAFRKLWAHRFRRFDQVLAPSRYMAEILGEAGVENVQDVSLGVDTDIFHPYPQARAPLRAALGLGARERLVVFAGRPAPEKRLDVLVEAVERLGPDYRLLLIGGGASRSRQVLTLPFQNDPARLARILSGCDALVHANPFETLGLVVLEAMACGVPVVGVAHGGVGETVDETFGQLAARATPEAMAEAIAALFDRDLSVLGARARTRAVERYRWDTTFEHLTQLYHRLTGLPAFNNSPASAP